MGLLEKAWREVSTVSVLARALWSARDLKPGGDATAADLFEGWAERTPQAVALHFESSRYTYAELDAAANRVAHWAHAQGMRAGRVAALLMENRPEFLVAWLGLAKVGAVTALINTNLHSNQLRHALSVAGADIAIVGEELADAYAEVCADIEPRPTAWVWGGEAQAGEAQVGEAQCTGDRCSGLAALAPALAISSVEPVPRSLRASVRTGDPLFYIYTSGTTGNPKAARFSHLRFLEVGRAYEVIASLASQDRMYCVLPLYHTAGGVVALSATWCAGATFVLRRKFSASAFLADCREHGVTAFQYIGELCRYLLHTPPSAEDHHHTIRVAIGNGLRPDIWEAFQERFAIPRIVEFYGATEGNFAIINIDNKPKSVGRIPAYLRRFFNVKLIKYDVDTETHPRDERGFCIECDPGEPGEAIGEIPSGKDVTLGRFEGYTRKEETAKKILRDVFRRGDAWFRTGDLLRYDDEGYYYFVDRIGDTFRWKGENVATSEVAEAISGYAGVLDVTVYGVQVPGTDGRAGMAALVSDENLDLHGLYEHVTQTLAPYAQPVFLRLREEMEVTSTFKHRKVDLVAEGFDPERVRDQLYFRDEDAGAYVTLDRASYERICSGQVRI